METTCLNCKKIFNQRETKKGYIMKFQKYCSNKCRSLYYDNILSKVKKGKTIIGKTIRQCPHCGKEFVVKIYNQKYCSKNCKDLMNYYKDRNKKLRQQKKYRKTHKDILKKQRRRYNSINQYKNRLRGLTYKYKKELLIILKSQCIYCGRKENLEFHHKEYPKNVNYRKMNREEIIEYLSKITFVLCHNCHNKLNIKTIPIYKTD